MLYELILYCTVLYYSETQPAWARRRGVTAVPVQASQAHCVSLHGNLRGPKGQSTQH